MNHDYYESRAFIRFCPDTWPIACSAFEFSIYILLHIFFKTIRKRYEYAQMPLLSEKHISCYVLSDFGHLVIWSL